MSTEEEINRLKHIAYFDSYAVEPGMFGLPEKPLFIALGCTTLVHESGPQYYVSGKFVATHNPEKALRTSGNKHTELFLPYFNTESLPYLSKVGDDTYSFYPPTINWAIKAYRVRLGEEQSLWSRLI